MFRRHDKRKPSERIREDFRTVDRSPWIVHYQGKIPQNPSGTYNIFADAIDPAIAEILCRERSKANTLGSIGAIDTHYIMGTVSLNKDVGSVRNLFQIYFNLSEVSKVDQPLVIYEVAKGLKKELLRAEMLGFLIRCKRANEFPFCVDDAIIDEFWFGWSVAYYKSICHQLEIPIN